MNKKKLYFNAVVLVFLQLSHSGLHYEAEVSVSYVEIFGDEILDLLGDGDAVAHSKAAAAKFVLAGESSVDVRSLAQVLTALELGERKKRTVCVEEPRVHSATE